MVRPDKIELVDRISGKLKDSQSVIFADFCGLTVEQMTDLRSRLRAKSVEFEVLKNRLGKRALAQAGCDPLDDCLRGNTGWAFGAEDPVSPAKILSDYARENAALVIKGGLLEGKRIDLEIVKELAALPGREELLSKMANGLMQPATKVVVVMQAALTKIARCFIALAEKKEGAEEAASRG